MLSEISVQIDVDVDDPELRKIPSQLRILCGRSPRQTSAVRKRECEIGRECFEASAWTPNKMRSTNLQIFKL
jgi:hypothetical protein